MGAVGVIADARKDVRARAMLTIAAAVPFGPAAIQFLRQGVPDYLSTGDAATLEIRVLHAARGAQLLGAYSRFFWSHPGPAFFYLALPVYEAFHERGPALNLFMLLVNLAGAIALVLIARRLRGEAFAWLTAALLAIFELVALPFVQTGEWNPVAPIFPLVLLSFLTARLALGGIGVLPVFALVASTIVQTHIGFLPEVGALCAVALGASLGAWLLRSWPTRPAPSLDRREWVIVATTAAVLIACWALPLYEAATNRPGNLAQLVEFFATSRPPDQSWETAFTALFAQMSVMPVALARSLHLAIPTPGPKVSEALALGQVALLIAALANARRRRDAILGIVAAIALTEMVAALFAIRAVRGELLPYLVLWTVVPGFMTSATAAAWLTRDILRSRPVAVVVAATWIVLTLTRGEPFAPVFREQNLSAEQLARNVAQYIRTTHLDHPVVRIASGDTWPTAAAVILHLRKQRIPMHVEPGWLFMFGKPLAPDAAPHPSLIVADHAFDEQARGQPQLTRVAESDEVSVYVEPAGFVASRRLPPPTLRSAAGMERDPHLAVDGAIPVDGTPWDAATSVIFKSATSALAVDVPRREVAGLFVSVDGNDLYTVRCIGGSNRSWSIGVRHPGEGVYGMQTRVLFDDGLAQCEAVEVTPASGDGLYSIAEIGFLRR